MKTTNNNIIATATAKKPTKRQMYTKLLELEPVKTNPEMVDFIHHEMELLTRKHSTENSRARKEAIDKPLKDAIVDILKHSDKPLRCMEINKRPELLQIDSEGFQTSKITAMLTKLQNEGIVSREEIKGKAYFAIK